MKNKKSLLLKILFSFFGIFSLYRIIQGYGLSLIAEEINRSGVLLVLLVLTFVPTIICYSLSWMFATEHRNRFKENSLLKRIIIFCKITVASIAWNNLTPFFKIGGEPLKYLMLSNYLPKQVALASTVNYNIIHLLATAFSFIITSILLLVFYEMPREIRFYSISFAVIFSAFLYLIIWMMRSKFIYYVTSSKYRKLRVAIISLKKSYRRLIYYYKNNPKDFIISLSLDVLARFIEGLTFFFAFYLIKHPITLFSSSLLDVGRTFIDNLFFFIPYQIGTREEGVRIFMEKMFVIDSKGFLTAVFLYRFVEIFWIFIGYIIWVSARSFSTDERV